MAGKLTDEERADLEALAERDDLKSSKWARRLLAIADAKDDE